MLAAEIITISDKLLTPFYPDTNTLWLTEQLNSIGIDLKLKTIVGNDEERLTSCLENAFNRSQIILVLLTSVESLFVNQLTTSLLKGSLKKISNPENDIDGTLISNNEKIIALLPNILSQLQPMFSEILPLLAQLVPPIYLRRRILKVVGMSESAVDTNIAPIYSLYQNLTTMILFFQNEVHIRLVASAKSEFEAEELLTEVTLKISAQLGKNLFTYQNETLEEVVANSLVSKGYTIAVTENGSGGSFATRLSSSPASELCLKQTNIYSYSSQKQIEVLDKDKNISLISNLVSPATAQALAVDAKERAGSTIGLSITGITDADEATAQLPVGLFFIGIADNFKVVTQKLLLPPADRERLRGHSSAIALDLIRRKYCCD